MNLKEWVIDAITKRNEYKDVQLAILNYVELRTKQEPWCLIQELPLTGNIPPIIFRFLFESDCFDTGGGSFDLFPRYNGLSCKGKKLQQKLITELKENPK